MKTTLLSVSAGTCRLHVRPSARESFTEYHVTATIDGVMPADEAADSLFTRVAAVLREKGIQTMQEKIYGLVAVRDEVLRHRERIYRERGLDGTLPATWIEGTPLDDNELVGVQIWGIAPHGGAEAVVTVEDPVNGRARLWTAPGFRMLHLPAVQPTHTSVPPAEQARQMFVNAGFGLQSHGFRYRDVVRTWIYCADLLDWYGDLNRVRTPIYRDAGLGTPGGAPFPASTGIMGRTGDEACLFDVLALDVTDPKVAQAIPIHRSPRQDQSFNYGSAFSRGMILDLEGRKTVHISGTASINPAGESVHIDDPELQSLETLMCIAAILQEYGGTLRNITSATLFCKTRAAWEAWERVSRLLQIPDFPKVCVLADVCRHDLLVEMEVVATL